MEETPSEILRFQSGHQIDLYSEGAEAFQAMERAIDAAQHHVHLETYILRTDRVGRRLLTSLAARARAGVSVRVIYDAVGSHGIDRRVIERIGAAGVEFEEFNPPSRWLWRFRPRRRDHRKMLLVDGRIGFLGGLNVGDEYVGDGETLPRWRDAHVRLQGPSVNELEALFVENWFRSGGSSFEWRSLVSMAADAGGELSASILADGPTYRRRRLRDFFVDELRRAQSRVLLVSPYFAPGGHVLEAMGAASERGVEIELVHAGYSDHPLLQRAARVVYPRLIRRGVRIFEDPAAMMHAKLAAFDDRLAIVGTSNLDRQSLQHNCEVNVVAEGPVVPKWIREHFSPACLPLEEVKMPLSEGPWPLRALLDRWATFWARL